ncbi:hypothetical protein [Nocardioides sp.]|uniref:hypothetical protein n=1 Tax=Nocardioides sp. TaxID=35761 RepID=UPI002BEBDD2E|nr:hypothetical protein [Nocardioides sp.]HSX68130.1 hypothetical protein [Nocardioides sp.]
MTNTYPGIEPVKDWVRAAAREVGNRFGIASIGGYGKRSNATDHDDGLALDYMTRNGGPLADYVKANAARLGVTYVIWNQRIWSAARNSEGWRKMPDRGSDTANHKDHVHVSFRSTAPSGFKPAGPPSGKGTAPQAQGSDPWAGIDPNANTYVMAEAALFDGAAEVVVYGVALTLGVGLLVLGAWRVSAPARKVAGEMGSAATTAAASLAGPQGKAAASAVTALKGSKA